MANIGDIAEGFLAAVFLLACIATALALVTLKLDAAKAAKILSRTRRIMLAAAGLSIVVLALLIVAFLTNDFSIALVGQYSDSSLPLFYKLSAVWAGSAGSLLLWTVGLYLLYALWMPGAGAENHSFEAIALSIGGGVCAVFAALLIFAAKPFASLSITLDEGMGLNPLLRNFWMAVHPPLLFIGYAALLVPFSVSLASVFARTTADAALRRQLRRWLLFGLCTLGAGIATGARWSYVELGWGGYWAWDPVENASLLPWLMAVAALHCLIGIRFSEKFRFYAFVTLPVPFILCLLATFITRSGILQSVHSFGRSVMPSALLVFIASCLLLWIVGIVRAAMTIPVSPPKLGTPLLDTIGLLFWVGIILTAAAGAIGVATFWPVIWRLISGSQVLITRSFYDTVIAATGGVLAFLAGLSVIAALQWRKSFMLYLLGCSAAGLIAYGLVFKQLNVSIVLALVCGVCAFSFVAVVINILMHLKVGGRIAANTAHLGLLLLVVGAGFAATGRIAQGRLAQGGRITLEGYDFIYDSFEHKAVEGITQAGPVILVKTSGLEKKLWPHSNVYPDGRSTAEAAVYTGALRDIYISFDGVDENGRAVITAKVKPLMLWVWLAMALLAAGPALGWLAGKPSPKQQTQQSQA